MSMRKSKTFEEFADRQEMRVNELQPADGFSRTLPYGHCHDGGFRPSQQSRPASQQLHSRSGMNASDTGRDAAFAIPALFVLLESEGLGCAIRIKGNPKLHGQVALLTTRRPCRPPNHVVR